MTDPKPTISSLDERVSKLESDESVSIVTDGEAYYLVVGEDDDRIFVAELMIGPVVAQFKENQ